ncbi:MAG: outer membrane lipoprotein-sorting protein [Chloroflexota bacterium]
MDRQQIKQVLAEYAQSYMPGDASINLWSGIRSQVIEAEQVRSSQRDSKQVRQGFRALENGRMVLTSLLASGVVLLGILSLLLYWTIQSPSPVSASEILARASAAADRNNTSTVVSTHAIVQVRYRNSPSEQFTQSAQEWWDQAPDKSRTDSRLTADGNDFYFVLIKVGTTRYMYNANTRELQIDTISRSATTAGGDLVTATGEASSIGKFGQLYDAVLLGDEQVAGRSAYVLELTAKATTGVNFPQYRKKVWIDKEAYLMLGEQDWDKDGTLLYESKCQRIEINPNLDRSIFELNPPAGTKIRDLRATPTPGTK